MVTFSRYVSRLYRYTIKDYQTIDYAYYIGNSRRFAYHEVNSSLDHERYSTPEWQDFDNAIRTFGIRKQTMINIIVDGRVKYKLVSSPS